MSEGSTLTVTTMGNHNVRGSTLTATVSEGSNLTAIMSEGSTLTVKGQP